MFSTYSQSAFPSRNYEGEHDLIEMQRFLMETRSLTDDWRYPHVGELLFSFFMVLCHLDPGTHVRLWHDSSNNLVAYAILGEDPSIDWQVAPGNEWSGIEDEVMAWVSDRLVEYRAQDPGAWSGPLVSVARQDNPARIEYLESCGFRYSGEFAEVNMLRSLDQPIVEAGLPDGFLVRSFTEADGVHSRAAAHCSVWQPWSVGNITNDDYARFMRLPGYHRDLDIAAFSPDGEIAAYVNGWIDPVNRIGDFGPVGAVPRFRRLGLTRAVLLEGLQRMRTYGMNRVCVSATEGNEAALKLYLSIGFQIVNRCLDFVRVENNDTTEAS